MTFDSENPRELDLTEETLDEGALEGLSHLAAALPIVGGFISSIASGSSSRRKNKRLFMALKTLNEDLTEIWDRLNQEYLRSEDFEELAEHVITKISETRSEERRRHLLNLLENDVLNGGITEYDSKIKYARLILETDPHLIMLLDAIGRSPEGDPPRGGSGSMRESIEKKLPPNFTGDILVGFNELAIIGLVINSSSLGAVATASAVHDTTGLLTVDGARFLSFIRSP